MKIYHSNYFTILDTQRFLAIALVQKQQMPPWLSGKLLVFVSSLTFMPGLFVLSVHYLVMFICLGGGALFLPDDIFNFGFGFHNFHRMPSLSLDFVMAMSFHILTFFS